MGRLGALVVVLAIVVAAAVVVQTRVVPEVNSFRPGGVPDMPAPAKKLSKQDQEKLKVLEAQFLVERDKAMKLRAAKAPEAELTPQQKKANDAAQAIIKLAGSQELQAFSKSHPSKSGAVVGPKDASAGATGASCSGEAGGSCSGEGGTCAPSSAEKPAEKAPAKAAAPAAKEAPAKAATKK